jgi:hypothetical protein
VAETELLGSLVGQLLDLVHGEQRDSSGDDPLAAVVGFGSQTSRPTDPVLLRLFPDGYQGDDESAADFRRFTEESLREKKSSAAATVLASLATADGARPDAAVEDTDVNQGEKVRVDLDKEQSVAWLRTLTDLRLALGTRLGVEEGDEEHWAALPPDDPRHHVHDVYDWLGWVQETLIRAVSP